MAKRVKISPQNERVLVKSIEVDNKTKSGLIISTEDGNEEGKIPTCFAEIVAVSDAVKDKHKVGDIVYHSARAGIPISLYDDKYMLLTDMEILAKLSIGNDDLDAAIRENIL